MPFVTGAALGPLLTSFISNKVCNHSKKVRACFTKFKPNKSSVKRTTVITFIKRQTDLKCEALCWVVTALQLLTGLVTMTMKDKI